MIVEHKTQNLRIVVVTTAVGELGSMPRYARLLQRVLAPAGIDTTLLHVACPPSLACAVGPFSVWINHAWIRSIGRKRLKGFRGGDILHLVDGSYAYAVPRGQSVPVVVTAHDVIPWLQTQRRLGPDRPGFMARKVIRASIAGLRRADRVVADSDQTASDLGQAGVPTFRVTTVHPALAMRSSGDDPISREPGLLLHVGNSGFYKNRLTVLEVLARLRDQHDARLVLAGAPLTSDEQRRISSLGLRGHVTSCAAPSDAELLQLYRKASVFLFPSFYEGFGWPPLEAMACGCPVVCSDGGSVPEVVGDAARVAGASDVAGLAAHCSRLMRDDDEVRRLVAKGYVNARRFSEERMGAELLSVYQEQVSCGTRKVRGEG